MGDDLSVVDAARVSFDKESEWECGPSGTLLAGQKFLSNADQKLLKYLATHNHWSPFSHATVKFRVKAPIFCARQLVKHTVGFSWNEVSRRYVNSEPEFYLPKVWRMASINKKQGSSDLPVTQVHGIGTENFARTCMQTALTTYEAMIHQGVCPEQARMVLPQNMMTEWIWTGTLYAWARMCWLRLDSHTQLETRIVAEKVSDTMRELFPYSWKVLIDENGSN